MGILKIDQKYKGVRQIEKRQITPKKQLTNYPKDKVKRVRIGESKSFRLIYQ